MTYKKYEEAVIILYEFIRKMNAWENNTKKRWDEYSSVAENNYSFDPNNLIRNKNWKSWMSEYMCICSKYCSNDSLIRGHSITTPRSYDPQRTQVDSVEELPSGDVLFRTSYHDFPLMDMAYQMTKENGEWKIRNRFYITPDGELLENEI